MKNLKKVIFLFMASVFLFSCDPENLPEDLSDLSVVNDTGEQEDIPDKKGDE